MAEPAGSAVGYRRRGHLSPRRDPALIQASPDTWPSLPHWLHAAPASKARPGTCREDRAQAAIPPCTRPVRSGPPELAVKGGEKPDALGCFGAVRHAGCFHQPFVTGSGPASARHPALTWVNTILGNIEALFAWHVSPPELQAPAALPCRVLLPVQSSLLAHRDVSPPRIRRPAHCADALPGAQTGGELSVIKMSLVRNQDNFSNTFCTNSRDTR